MRPADPDANDRLVVDARMLAAELQAIAQGEQTTLNPGEADRFAAVVEALAEVRRDEQVARLARVLSDIADADYRGNRSPESVAAHRALVREGFRAD